MSDSSNHSNSIHLPRKLEFDEIYRREHLYRSVVSLYTKSLFFRQKARTTSWDGKDLYDFAQHSEKEIRHLHQELTQHTFQFSPAKVIILHRKGKDRTVYIWPWRERVVDLMLYQVLEAKLDCLFGKNVFAFRRNGWGVDKCQERIEKYVRKHTQEPLFLLKRDVSNCFPSLPHEHLMAIVDDITPQDDYLHQLLTQHIAFHYFQNADTIDTATQGVPFGAPTACLLANLTLRPFDELGHLSTNCCYTRYADDMLFLTPDATLAQIASDFFAQKFNELGIVAKPSATINGILAEEKVDTIPKGFMQLPGIKHLGIFYNPGGIISLSMDKQRKICDLFSTGFKRCKRRLQKERDTQKRARILCQSAKRTLEHNLAPIAIVDYYLKHVNDTEQLGLMDRWLAEEVLALTFQNGHKKGNFGKISFTELRNMGLPSLVHRRQLLLHGHLDTSFMTLRKTFQKSQ